MAMLLWSTWKRRLSNFQNRLCLSGVLVEKDARRSSPAGVAFCNAQLKVEGEVEENNILRRVAFEMPIVAAGEMAYRLESLPLNTNALFGGFLATKSQRHKALVFHIQSIELLKGI